MHKIDIFEYLKKEEPIKFTSSDLAIVFECSEGHMRNSLSLLVGSKKYYEIKRSHKIIDTVTGERLVYQYYYEDD